MLHVSRMFAMINTGGRFLVMFRPAPVVGMIPVVGEKATGGEQTDGG